MKFEAVIFDLDGTLLDTLADLADSTNIVLERFGFPEHNLEAYKYFVGDGMEKLTERALPEGHRDRETVSQALNVLKEIYGERQTNKTVPYHGITELLDALREKGLKTAVLSNKPQEFTQEIIGHMLAGWHFEKVMGSRPGVPKKPDPTAAIELADNLNIHASKILYLGDTNIDMKTANAAGMFAVGALWGFRTREELITGGAKEIIKHPLDLMELL